MSAPGPAASDADRLLDESGRLLAGPRRAVLSALAGHASGRRSAPTAPPPRRRDGASGLGAAAAVVDRGRTCLGRQRPAAVPPRRGTARAAADRAAAADRGGTGRSPAHAPGGGAVPGTRPDSGRGAGAVRRGHRLGAAPAQFVRGGGPADSVRLRRRGRIHLADAGDARRGELVRRVGGREMAAVAGRVVDGRREPAAVPVPAPALVFPAVHLGALPVAGVAHRAEFRADASGSLRRPGLPRRW